MYFEVMVQWQIRLKAHEMNTLCWGNEGGGSLTTYRRRLMRVIHLTDKGAILHGLHLVLGKGAFTCACRETIANKLKPKIKEN